MRVVAGRLGLALWDGEQLAGARDVGRAIAIGEQSIVTDAMHALGQHMHQEAPDELVS